MGYTRRKKPYKKKYKNKQLKKQYKTQKKYIRQAGGSVIPIYIICWNQYTYVKSMVEQLQKYDVNMKIFIIDNKSTYEPLLKYLKEIDGKNGVKVLYQPENYGHKVYERPEFIAMAGEKYVVTDPDLLFNPNMPKNFLDILSELSDKYKTNKIGLALDITNNIDLTKTHNGITLPELERKIGAWDRPLNPRDPEYELYTASIDTTFALINSKYRVLGDLTNSIRVAGNFTAVHRPWTIGFEKDLLPGELDYYLKNKDNISTTLNQWKTVQTGGKNISKPTFHILISTLGRPSLKRMLDSLKGQLSANDAITIVFDGPDALKKSGYTPEWVNDFKCPVKIIEQNPALGFWGHEARNKYQTRLEPKTTFILNADDDDKYVDGVFDKLREKLTNPDKLYIARMTDSANNSNRTKYLPKNNNLSIKLGNIGTPCGIIPFNKAGESQWTHHHGGDFDYYNGLKDKVAGVEFIDILLYKIR